MRPKVLIVVAVFIIILIGVIFLMSQIFGRKGYTDFNRLFSGPKEVFNTTRGGELNHDEVWSGEILLTSDIFVPQGITLSILPGAVVKAKHYRFGYQEPERRIALRIAGKLVAIGEADKLIRFTSDAQKPEHSDWWGLQVEAGGEADISHTIIEFGFTNFACLGGTASLKDNILRWATGGVSFFGNQCQATVERNRIYGGGHNAIEIEGESEIMVKDNHLYQNTHGGVVVLDWSKAWISGNIMENSSWGIVVQSAEADIRYNLIRNSVPDRGQGIMIQNLGAAQIFYNTIANGQNGGISFSNLNPAVETKVAFNNLLDRNALIFETKADVSIENNWFGTKNEREIENRLEGEAGKINSFSDFKIIEDGAGRKILPQLSFDFENRETYDHLPGTPRDTFLYAFPSDETREVIERIYARQSSYPAGLAWDGKNFWVSDQPNFIYQLDEKGEIIKTIEFPTGWPYGMSWDKNDNTLWVSGYTEGKIYKIDTNGNVLKKIDAPCPRAMGLEFDDRYLWTGCFEQTGTLYKIDTDGRLIEKFENLPEAWGIGFDGEYLWISGGNSDMVYQVDPQTGQILGKIYGGGFEPRDCAWVKDHLWCLDWLCEDCLIGPQARLFKLKILKILTAE